MARVLNLVFALANSLVCALNLGPGLLAILNGDIDLFSVHATIVGAGVLITVIAMVRPQRIADSSVHLFALAFFATLNMVAKLLSQAVIFFYYGFLFMGFYNFFFACSLAWGLWFVYQLVRIRHAQIKARRVISR